ncbi:MAG: cytochrome c [Planctomycetes bacterium]|nr:cytochrome c [Planctomycetota bacterium]
MPLLHLTQILCSALAALACTPEPQEPAARSGKEIYLGTCAVCHGDTGDGNGLVKFDRPARSFQQGGFSFGNTPEALFRTVSSGIGGTPMPGFAAVLNEKERRLVVEYVIALGPEQPPAAGNASILNVGSKPVVVRGQLAPLKSGASELPRGLMIGTTDGLSWQYQADDVRLLAVRQGAFLDRKDWGGRGGGPLQPLGKLMHLLQDGEPGPSFMLQASLDTGAAKKTGSAKDTGADNGANSAIQARRALYSKLTSTLVTGQRAEVRYALMKDAVFTKQAALMDSSVAPQSTQPGTAVANVREWGEAFSHPSAAGFRRHFEVEGVAGKRPDLLIALDIPKELNGPSELVSNRGQTWVWFPWQGRAIAYGFQIEGIPFAMMLEGEDSRLLLPAGNGVLKVHMTTLLLPDAKAETWSKLQEEIY